MIRGTRGRKSCSRSRVPPETPSSAQGSINPKSSPCSIFDARRWAWREKPSATCSSVETRTYPIAFATTCYPTPLVIDRRRLRFPSATCKIPSVKTSIRVKTMDRRRLRFLWPPVITQR